jgi:hypothetical protein
MTQSEFNSFLNTIETKFEVKNLTGKSRKRELVDLRAAIYKHLRDKKLTMVKIGAFFNRTHNSVYTALSSFDYITERKNLLKTIQSIQSIQSIQ